ncbi:MAG: glycosyltransferase [Mycobacteriales bacterium]
MSQIVVATLDAGGNVPPIIGIGRALVADGHDVHVIGHPAQRDVFEAAALGFTPYTSGRPWSPTAKKSTLVGLLDLVGVFNDRGAGSDVVALSRRVRADVVAVDCMLLGVLAATQEAGFTSVSLFHTFHAYFDGPWRRGPVGLLSRLRGHQARQVWDACDQSLVLSLRDLDPVGTKATDRLTWTGPVVDGAPAPTVTPPRVLVSLSTTAFPGMAVTLQRIVDALGTLPAEIVVTTGPSIDPSSLTVPDNTSVHRYVDHAELMPTCSAVVGHGGHATTMRALAHGLPVLVIPAHPMLDQKMVGESLARAGAGLALTRKATGQEIKDAVQTLLSSPDHRAAAAALGHRIRDGRGAQTAAKQLAAHATSAQV